MAFTIIALTAGVIGILILFIRSILFLNRVKDFPGPRPRLPILGNIVLFYRPEIPLSQMTRTISNEAAKNFRENGMFSVFLGSKMTTFLISAQLASEFLKDNHLINKAVEYDSFKVWLGNGLITSNGAVWKNKRRLLTPAFHSKILENYIPTMNEQCLRLVSKLTEATKQPYIDIRELMSETTLNIISMTAMGILLNDDSEAIFQYRQCLKRLPSVLMSRLYNPLNWYDFIFYRRTVGKQVLQDVNQINRFTQNVINQRRINFKPGLDSYKSKQMSFLDLLLTLQSEDNAITDEDIRSDVGTFMFAGHDTSAVCLSWTLLLLGNNPECQDKVIQEMNEIFGDDRQRHVNKEDINHMHYTECVIKESLRLFPPVPIIGLITNNEVTIGGHKFPSGSSIFVELEKANKDEDYFPNANEFIPERFERQTMSTICLSSFAMGPRNCIGQRFAMIEMKIILAHIFRNFTFKSHDKCSDVSKCEDVVLTPVSPIRISFHRL